MKFIRLLFAFTLSASALAAHARSEGGPTLNSPRLELEVFEANLPGHPTLAYQFRAPQHGRPTYILLPGVNRGTMFSDPAVEALTKDGSGVLAINFSAHPLSVAQLKSDDRINFDGVTLKSLAQETVALARKIAKQYAIPLEHMIPVTLSYSGAVSPWLTEFPVVVDMVPLTSFRAFNPQLSLYYDTLKAGELLNPIFGPAITRASLDTAYRTQWIPQVQSMIQQYALPEARRGDMVEGYTALSRAVEGYSWAKEKPSKSVRRVFVIAENESNSLQADQLRTILDLKSQGYAITTVVIGHSGHIIPSDQPGAYVTALRAVADDRWSEGTLTWIDPIKNRVSTLEKDAGDKLLRSMLEKSAH